MNTKISGADYAEYFEWEDGNVKNEDRVGYFVTLNNNKIKLASITDTIIGIISATPTVLGLFANNTKFDQFLTDEFGRVKKEIREISYTVNEYDPELGEYVSVEKVEKMEINLLNSNYDRNANIETDPAWAVVGMLGQLRVYDDGTCQPGGYCKCNNEGIATKCENNESAGYYVMDRIDENVIRILFK